jgi:hypothetical protein
MRFHFLLPLFAVAVACGDSGDPVPEPAPSTPSLGGPGFTPQGPDGGGKDGGGVDDGCSEAAKLVYVLSEEKDLYRFYPPDLTFTKIGRLSCPNTADKVAVSMAVDRSATAWVNYANGGLYKVSTADATCTDTGFVPNQAGFLKFGMAFVSDSAGSPSETLFISGLLGTAGKGLGTIDTNSLKLTMIADYPAPLAGVPAELTGNGNAELFGFFASSPQGTFAKIDQKTAVTSNAVPLDVGKINAFAFSFWGGDFWFYTTDGTTPSRVTRRKSTGETAVVKADVGGFRIAGAGVSTCAPLTSPK